ncbi:alanine racemase [Virgibacillus sp. W0181]|uniref:alanine racemase n=1 Tax=Virgibacillus sp. W0181 TaxID=3391581 RepID=UPI003F46BF84
MTNQMVRKTWAEIDLNAIGYNIEQIRNTLLPTSKIIAVVKANAYGHGAVEVARKALESGVAYLAVSLLEEALELREANIDAPILVIGWVPPEAAVIASEKNITLTIYQIDWLQALKEIRLPKMLNVHMEWDTGMGRTGIRTEAELIAIMDELIENQCIYLTGVYTHFSTADEVDNTYVLKQKERIKQLTVAFEKKWMSPVDFHMSNSAAAIMYPRETQQYIRLGISMYGLYPSEEVKRQTPIRLKPTFSLHSQLIHVKKVSAGEFIGYGATYQTKEDEWIGTISIGYGDGWIRNLRSSSVLVNGKLMPIVGRICMDQTMIRLDKPYKIGTMVTLIGKQGDAEIKMEEISDRLNTINYEVPCMINARVPRIYVN